MAKLTIVVDDVDAFKNLYRDMQQLKAACVVVDELGPDYKVTADKLEADMRQAALEALELIVAIEACRAL